MKIIIIGGVAAGMSAAAKASRMNKEAKITIYEKTDIVSWGACGLPYYVGDFYESPNNMIARPVEKFIEAGMDIRIKHEVLSVDAIKKTVTVKNLVTDEVTEDNYDKLMVATGASAILPPIKNIKLKNVFTIKEYVDGNELKKEAKKQEKQNIIMLFSRLMCRNHCSSTLSQIKTAVPHSRSTPMEDIMARGIGESPGEISSWRRGK